MDKRGKIRFLRLRPEDEVVLAEACKRFPRIKVPALLSAAIVYGLRAAMEKPAQVLLGETETDGRGGSAESAA